MRRLLIALVCGAMAGSTVTAQVPSQPTLPPPAGNLPVIPAAATPQPGDAVAPLPAATRTCPAQVDGAFNATRLICEGLQEGQVCLGNGITETTARPEVSDAALRQPADRRSLTDFTSLRLRTLDTEGGLLTVIAARPRLQTTTGQPVSVLLLAFGDVALADDGDVVQEVSGQRSGTVVAGFGLNIRRAPDGGADLLWQLRPGERVTVTGRLADRTWVRVVIPNGFGTPGWVYAPYLEVAGGIDTLGVVDVNSPVPTAVPQQRIQFTSMQAYRLTSRNIDPSCDDAPNSGLLLQTPDGVASRVRTRVNGVEMEFNGTLFVRSQPAARLSVIVLEGEARFIANGFTSEAVAGQEVLVDVNDQNQATSAPVPDVFDGTLIRNLPVSVLARPVALAGGAAPAPAIAAPAEAAALAPPPTPAPGLPTPVATPVAAPPSLPVTGSLTSAATGELCGQPPATLTESAGAIGLTTDVGGVWRAAAGTTVTFEVSGGTFQREFGNFIRLNAVTGIVARSGQQQTLTHTFTTDTAFSASFSAVAGETLTVTVRCGG